MEKVKYLLIRVLFNLGEYSDIIQVDKLYEYSKDSYYKLIIAQSYYFLKNYQNSFDIASNMMADIDYGYEFQKLTGLCVRNIYSNEDAIGFFAIYGR